MIDVLDSEVSLAAGPDGLVVDPLGFVTRGLGTIIIADLVEAFMPEANCPSPFPKGPVGALAEPKLPQQIARLAVCNCFNKSIAESTALTIVY